MSQHVKLFSPTINLTEGRVDAAITFTVNSEKLCTGDGSQNHLKKCLLAALLKEAKDDCELAITLKTAGWNFVVEPGIDLSDKFKHHGPGGLDFTEVKRIPGLEEFCKGRGIEVNEVKSVDAGEGDGAI